MPAAASETPAPSSKQRRGPMYDQVGMDGHAGTRRTPSGLVKRTPRVVDTGEVRAIGRGPNDDLLASLSRYTNGRELTGATPAVDPRGPAPSEPFGPAARAGSPFTPPSGNGGLGGGGLAGGGLGGGLAAGLSGLSPFQGGSRGDSHRGPRPASHADAGPPPAPAPALPGPLPGGMDHGATAGGLTRRVRGAQLPNAAPLAIRRGGGAAGGLGATPPPVAPAPPPQPAPRTAGRHVETPRSADAVYSFLTSFTAGVQQGLDDARADGPGS
jgi:hypothetical protein